ncbi:MAG TPA: hypothetical protein VNQ73_00705 [Ilumatobacter sp.]|nr:hypothetical protein [Ilumatobacter sp.]
MSGTVLTWVARIAWAAAGVLGWDALDGAPVVAQAAAGLLWLGGVAGLAVPSVVTLALARVVVPVGLPAAVATWAAGGPAGTSAGALVAVAAATVAVGAGEFGQAYAQASAYGHELRFPLRPPPAFLLAAGLAWLLAAAGLVGGVVLLADGQWLIGVPVTAIGAAVAVFAWPRWYRLARRWLVVVPAGVVVHDHLVLSETVMFPRADVAAVLLAPVGTDAADLTGPAPGHPLELRLHHSATAILAGTPRRPGGTAIHLTACLVAPTRPGAALTALATS